MRKAVLLAILTYGALLGASNEKNEVQVNNVQLTAVQQESQEKKIVPLVAERPDPEPLRADKPELTQSEPEQTLQPLDTQKPVYTYGETVELINKYVKEGGTEAYVKGMSRIHHIQWHDMKDGFINFPKDVVRRLNVEQQQYLHGYLHAMEDGIVENVQCEPEQLERVLDQTPIQNENQHKIDYRKTRIVYFTAEWCGFCKKFKNEGMFELLKKEGWDIGPEADNMIQIVDVDKNKNRFGITGTIGMPSFYMIKNGRVVKGSRINPRGFMKNGKLQKSFIRWMKEKGNIFKW